jgi:hypothetical protein
MYENRRRIPIGLLAAASVLWLAAACSQSSTGHDSAVRDTAGQRSGAPGAFEEAERPALQATPGLPPDIAVTSTALSQRIMATEPATGGGQRSEEAVPAAEGPAAGRMIIKNATMSLEVDDVDLALSRIDGIAAQSGGYVLETRTDYSNPFQKQAFVQIAVPVDRFEAALQRIREAAGEVLSEQASGVDVSQEFVDVQSQIANLEATQARVRQLLAEADTVEEALRVNAELTRIEGELGKLKGRSQYLQQRSAFSTIAASLQEPRPDPTATATPTVTPTPSATPTATPRPPWQPGRTAGNALSALRAALQTIGDALIWLVLGLLPALVVAALPFVLVAYAVRHIRNRRRGA